MYDIAIGIDATMVSGILDVSKQQSPLNEMENTGKRTWKIVTPAPIAAWVATKGGKNKPIGNSKTLPAEDAGEGHLFGDADIVSAYSGIMSVIRGEKMMVAVKYSGQQDYRRCSIFRKDGRQGSRTTTKLPIRLVKRLKKG